MILYVSTDIFRPLFNDINFTIHFNNLDLNLSRYRFSSLIRIFVILKMLNNSNNNNKV